MKKLLFIVLIVPFLFVCSCAKYEIKKELESSYTNFEIIEIRPDSANIFQARNSLTAIKIRVARTSYQISNYQYDILLAKNKKDKLLLLYKIDSLYDNMFESMEKFEKSYNEYNDKCYYVKYTVPIYNKKILFQEYFLIRENKDILHRSYEWRNYLYKEGWNDLVKEILEMKSEIMDLRYELTGKLF